MRLNPIRALVVAAVFALFTVLAVADPYLNSGGSTSVYAVSTSTWGTFLAHFRYYFAWALVAPGVWWLGRAVPFTRRRWPLALVVHLAVPVVGTLPFWAARVVLNIALGAGLPSQHALTTMRWDLLFVRQLCMVFPVYWLVLAVGAAVQVLRDRAANEMRAATLQRSLAAAQLDGLRMKAQPRVLFTTLRSMASLARAGDTGTVVRIVDRLGVLLRLSMDTSDRQVVTLEEELALLDQYLAIEEIRFKDRLRIVRRVDREVRTALVPNLILQPLAHNALFQGDAPGTDANLLEIAAHRDGNVLRIAMRNDRARSGRDGRAASSADPGLKTVVERLEGLYGDRSRIELTSDAAGRRRVLLSLPFSEGEVPAA